MENIVLRIKVFPKQKPVPFRRYIFILIGKTYYMNGTGQWRTCVCYTIQTRNTYSRSLQIIYLRLDNKILILSHRRCFVLSMKYSMRLFNNTENVSVILMTVFWLIYWRVLRILCFQPILVWFYNIWIYNRNYWNDYLVNNIPLTELSSGIRNLTISLSIYNTIVRINMLPMIWPRQTHLFTLWFYVVAGRQRV